MRAAPAVGFEYRASRILVAATIFVGLLAIVAVWISGLPHWWQSVISVLALTLAVHAIGRLLRPRVQFLLWRSDGGVDIRTRDTTLEDGRDVLGSVRGSRVMGPLIVLTLAWPPRERASLWLLPDNLDADTHRRLRMRLGTRRGDFASGNPDSG